MRRTRSIPHLSREFVLFREHNIFALSKRITRFFCRQRTQSFKVDHLGMTVEYRCLDDACRNHQPFVLQDFAYFVNDTTFFTHATFAIRQ